MDYLESMNKAFAFVFDILEKPQTGCDCTHDWEFVTSKKIAEGLYRVGYACMHCGEVRTSIEEGDNNP